MLVAGSSYTTRGHDFRLQKIRARYDLRKYYFTNRVVNMWNYLLSSYVVSAESVNCFKNRLDNFWKDQIFVLRFTEPETAVKLQFDSFRLKTRICTAEMAVRYAALSACRKVHP